MIEFTRRHLLQSAGLALGLPAWAQAQPVLAVGATFARLFMPGPQGRPQGLAVDLLERILLPLGQAPRYELYPWLRAQAMLAQGQAQILIGPYRTPEREALMRFSQQAFYEDAMLFYVRREALDLWRGDYAALAGLRVGVVQGWVYGAEFEQRRAQLRPEPLRDLATGLRMLERGRLDLLAANERNAQPVLEALGLGQALLPCRTPLGRLRGHFAFGLDEAGALWRQRVDAGLARLRASGELATLAARWQVTLPSG